MERISYFDAHCDTLSRCEKRGCRLTKNDGQLDLERLGEFRRAAQCFAIFHDLAEPAEGGMLAECRRQQALFVQEMAANAELVRPCRSGQDIRSANTGGRIAALLTCEGAELLDCDPANLSWAQEVGIRIVNLTWNYANAVAGSHKRQPESGLSELGQDFVREAQRRDIFLDVSHCSDAAFWDLMKLTEKPVVATHSCARSVCAHSRNLSDDMFRAILETGGFVGVNLYASFISAEENTSIDDVLRHFDRFLELGGEKHIGLGADLDGCDRLAGGLRGVEDMPRLWEALRAHGYDETLLEDIFYNNLLRLFS